MAWNAQVLAAVPTRKRGAEARIAIVDFGSGPEALDFRQYVEGYDRSKDGFQLPISDIDSIAALQKAVTEALKQARAIAKAAK